ncbi:MAG: hypothetical protein U9Q15_03370 [Patescibacteria group bacterium]|nr:hypothetical protein [Patescibacteria group bacterium]
MNIVLCFIVVKKGLMMKKLIEIASVAVLFAMLFVGSFVEFPGDYTLLNWDVSFVSFDGSFSLVQDAVYFVASLVVAIGYMSYNFGLVNRSQLSDSEKGIYRKMIAHSVLIYVLGWTLFCLLALEAYGVTTAIWVTMLFFFGSLIRLVMMIADMIDDNEEDDSHQTSVV